jgi:beta-glucosidase
MDIGAFRINLAPGEKKQVTFTITPAQMAFVNNDGNRVLEPGKFKITLGGSQGDTRSILLGATPSLSGEFNVTGKTMQVE